MSTYPVPRTVEHMEPRLRAVVAEMERLTAERDQLIRDLHSQGSTLRAIAEVAGLSHPGVRKIIKREAGA